MGTVALWGDENILGMTVVMAAQLRTCRTPLDYILDNGENGKFYVMYILPQFLKSKGPAVPQDLGANHVCTAQRYY